MTTGFRRGELCAIRWRDIDFDASVLVVERSIGQRNRQIWEKDTKDHQQRRIALDSETLALLEAHRQTCEADARAVDVALGADAFVFSRSPDGSTPLRPDSVSQKYSNMVRKLGFDTSLHKLGTTPPPS